MPLAPIAIVRAFKYAMYFNGVNAYAEVPASSSLYLPGDFTVCAWIGITQPFGFWPGIIDNGRNNVANWWFLGIKYTPATDAGIGFTDGTFMEIYFPNEEIGTFHQYCFGVSGSTFFGYRDGSLYQSPTFTETRNVQSLTIDIGNRVGGGYFANVYVHQVLVYNRALSSTEIAQNYNNPDSPVKDGLMLWLQADPAYISGNTWLDLSSNGNNATLNNTQLVQLINPPIAILQPIATPPPIA
jgi:hypothetical protein